MATKRVMRVFVTRLPIFDPARAVIGYELRFRAAPDVPTPEAGDDDHARVITEALLSLGLDDLTDGKPAFIPVGRWLLTGGVPAVLAPDKVVLQLAGDVAVDRAMHSACESLQEAGYPFAIDDVATNARTTDLVGVANFLKIDIAVPADQDPTPARLGGPDPGPVLIATRVDTVAQCDDAVARGYTHIQGEFLSRPRVTLARALPSRQLGNLRLLQALHKTDLSVHQLESLIEHDAALCYRILHTVNSSAYALPIEVDSIREALVLLGRDTIRRWASLWSLADLQPNVHPELLAMSSVRGQCAETLANSIGGEDAAVPAFLAGMCSLLDAIFDRPMPSVLAELPLPEAARSALFGKENFTRRVLDCVIAYERADWDRALELAGISDIRPIALATAYADALRWSKALQHEGGPPVPRAVLLRG